jgi:sugar/nucleoside kinase (ribokinase family)
VVDLASDDRPQAHRRGSGLRVLYDPNLRAGRWPDAGHMLAVARDALEHVTLVKANADEAAALTGAASP